MEKKIAGGLASFIKNILVIFISVFAVCSFVFAGSLTPSASPVATGYTLNDIYNRLITNATATSGDHIFSPGASPIGTLHTLAEIYGAIPTIEAGKVLYGISYLGITGSVYGDTDPTKVLTVATGKAGTYNAANLTAGNIKLDVAFGASGELGTLAPNGTAATSDCLATKTFYSDNSWTQKTGSISTQTLSADSDTVSAGYYAATTLHGVDADLAVGNIKKSTAIFGLTGTLYGDIDPTKVLTVAGAAGTYNAANLTVGNIKLDVAFGASGELGTLAPDGTAATGDCLATKTFYSGNSWTQKTGGLANCFSEGSNACYAASGYWTSSACASEGSQTCYATGTYYAGTSKIVSNSATSQSAGYYPAFNLATADADLVSGNIKSGVTIFGIDGNGNVVDTSSGNATIGDILSGKIAWAGGSSITGNIANCGSEGSQTCYAIGSYYAGTSKTASNSTTSQSAGYYPAFNLATVDSDLVASNISANANIFGLAGTLLKNQYNGSATTPATDFAFWTQALGGVDDYNDGQAFPPDSYVGQWLTCNVNAYDAVSNPGGNWCNTGDSNANKKDLSTGLVWSTNLDSATAHTWFWANSCYLPAAQTPAGVCAADGDDGCQCQKLPVGSKTGCEALGDLGWRLPYQKELMQVYINGSWTNLTSAGYSYWSSSTKSTLTHYAWIVNLSTGYTDTALKTNTASYRARCVR